VNCDLPYWFDVNMVANGTNSLAIDSNFNVFCKDDTIFVRINGDKVYSIFFKFFSYCSCVIYFRISLEHYTTFLSLITRPVQLLRSGSFVTSFSHALKLCSRLPSLHLLSQGNPIHFAFDAKSFYSFVVLPTTNLH
jgi:hypothetical protein